MTGPALHIQLEFTRIRPLFSPRDASGGGSRASSPEGAKLRYAARKNCAHVRRPACAFTVRVGARVECDARVHLQIVAGAADAFSAASRVRAKCGTRSAPENGLLAL